jgi:hypothetical protein
MLICAIFQPETRKKQTKIDCIENVNEVISIFWSLSAPSQAANLCVLSFPPVGACVNEPHMFSPGTGWFDKRHEFKRK